MKNIGDDAILFAEITQLQKLKIPLTIFVPSRYPENVTQSFPAESFRFGDFSRLISALFLSDLIIIGGGGLFCHPGKNISKKKIFTDFLFTLYKIFFFILLPKILQKKVIAFGIGYYRNQSPMAIRVTSFALQFIDYISVRDRHSYNFLQQLLPKKEIQFLKDVVFTLEEKGNMSNSKLVKDDKVKKIGISLAHIADSSKLHQIIASLSDIINNASDKYHFYYFPFNTQEGNNDHTVGQILQEQLKQKHNFTMLDDYLGPQVFLCFFKELDAAVCMRFHSQVFAHMQHIPFIGISYDKKCSSFLDDIDATYCDINQTGKSIAELYTQLIHKLH